MLIMKKESEVPIYKIFSNKERLNLLVCLSTPKNVTELLGRCHLSQSALSQHLKLLKDASVAECSRDGKKQIYFVPNKKIILIAKSLLKLDKKDDNK